MGESFQQKLKNHVTHEHGITPFSTYLRQIVYGGSDGIVTTFAVVAGFTGAQSGQTATYSIIAVLLFGLANLFADGTSMAVGEFLSSRSERDVFLRQKKKEQQQITDTPDAEFTQTIGLLKQQGFSSDHAEQLAKIYQTNQPFWIDFMMKYQLEMQDPTEEKPHINAAVTFGSFVFFGFMPLIPYLITQEVMTAFLSSIGASLAAMTLLGTLRMYISNQSPIRAIGETVALGVISASVAFGVGLLFRGHL